MILVDGKLIAELITEEVISLMKSRINPPIMSVITCDPNFETKKFLALKQKKAESLGVIMKTIVLSRDVSTTDVVAVIKRESDKVDGIIVQLPLPKHIDTDTVLAAIPKRLDVDVFSYAGEITEILPPVVGAIMEIAKYYKLDWQNKKIVIFGNGRLVGKPMALYGRTAGASVQIVTEVTENIESLTQKADIIVLGVGKPNLLTANMIKAGVAIFDAGASEDGGLLVGDAHGDVASKASLLTPVPGGIGPLTVILLFRNLLKLDTRQ